MGLIETVKDVAKLVQQMDNLELNRKIIELQSDVLQMVEVNHAMKAELQEAKAKLEFAKALTYKEPFWYAEGDSTPYCPQCWEADKMAIHIPHTGTNWQGAFWDCPKCKFQFIDASKATTPLTSRDRAITTRRTRF